MAEKGFTKFDLKKPPKSDARDPIEKRPIYTVLTERGEHQAQFDPSRGVWHQPGDRKARIRGVTAYGPPSSDESSD